MTIAVSGLEENKALAGTELGHTDWLEITQDRVNVFGEATGDLQWIHVDVERAKAGPFGGPIAHGYLTLSLIIPLFNDLLVIDGITMSVNYGLNKVRFPAPVPVGSKVRLRGDVAEVNDAKGSGVEMTLNFAVEIEGGEKPACVAQAVYRHYA